MDCALDFEEGKAGGRVEERGQRVLVGSSLGGIGAEGDVYGY